MNLFFLARKILFSSLLRRFFFLCITFHCPLFIVVIVSPFVFFVFFDYMRFPEPVPSTAACPFYFRKLGSSIASFFTFFGLIVVFSPCFPLADPLCVAELVQVLH